MSARLVSMPVQMVCAFPMSVRVPCRVTPAITGRPLRALCHRYELRQRFAWATIASSSFMSPLTGDGFRGMKRSVTGSRRDGSSRSSSHCSMACRSMSFCARSSATVCSFGEAAVSCWIGYNVLDSPMRDE